MKTYLFLYPNNGHFKTYHPFCVNPSISQERANEIMLEWGGARRMGVGPDQFMEMLENKGYDVEYWYCPCCKNEQREIVEPDLSKWDIIEGISGNY